MQGRSLKLQYLNLYIWPIGNCLESANHWGNPPQWKPLLFISAMCCAIYICWTSSAEVWAYCPVSNHANCQAPFTHNNTTHLFTRSLSLKRSGTFPAWAHALMGSAIEICYGNFPPQDLIAFQGKRWYGCVVTELRGPAHHAPENNARCFPPHARTLCTHYSSWHP